MRKILVALFMLFSFSAQAQLTQSQVNTIIANEIPSCGTGCITAQELRNVLGIMNQAAFQSQGASGFILSGTPSAGYVPAATGSSAASWQALDIPLSSFCTNLATPGVDITTCLQAAIDAAQTAKACLVLPVSTAYWLLSSTINFGDGSAGTASTLNNYCLKAPTGGAAATIYGGGFGFYLIWSGAANGTMFKFNGPINGIALRGIMLNGNNIAGRLMQFNSVRDVELVDMGGSACTIKCWDFEGLASTGDLNFQITTLRNYITTSVNDAIGINFDGVLANSTDTWLSTFTNTRVESTGTNGIAMRLGLSDNILFQQFHAVANGTGGCGVQFNSTTSGTGGNAYPKGHLFVKSAILGGSGGGSSTCVKSTGGNAIGVNNFVEFGTTDGENVPTNANLRGVTDQGVTFGGWGSPPAAVSYTPTYAQVGGTQGTGMTTSGQYVLSGTANYAVYISVVLGASSVTSPGFSLSVGLPSTPILSGSCSGVNQSSGKSLSVAITGGVSTLTVRLYDATFPVINSDNFVINCVYQ